MIINMNGAKAPETPSPVLQEKTVTPETLPTVIGPDEGYDGLSQVTVNPDAQLKAENIRSGKSIFGVTGVFEGVAVPTPMPYGSTLLGGSMHANKILISANDNVSLTLGDYSGPMNYMDSFTQLRDVELRRIIGSNTFSTRQSTLSNEYIISYDGGPVTFTDGVNISFPTPYNTQLTSEASITAKFLIYAVGSASLYRVSINSPLFHPIEIVECECTVSSSSSKNYLYVKPTTDITVNVPAMTTYIDRQTLEEMSGYTNYKATLTLRLAPIELDYSTIYE